MDFLLTAIGSHGDVHPLVGIALELKNRGHRATLVANPHFQGLVERVGLEFLPVGTEEQFEQIAQDPNLWHPTKGVQTIARHLISLVLRETYGLILDRYQPSKVAVVSAALDFGARVAQDKHGIPTISVQLAPSVFRSFIESPHLPPAILGNWVPKWAKRWQFHIADRWIIDPIVTPELNAFRSELGLAPVSKVLDSWWHSPLRVIGMFPEWFGPPQPDWPSQVRLASFPLWDEKGVDALPSGADEFLREGSPPVAFTPGSAMVQGRPFFRAAVDACRRLKCRGVLLTRHAEQIPKDLPDSVRHFDFLPFSYLLPRCAAVVHHGGIGSLSQALAAGVPQLIMPMTYDQPDNALRLQRLGVSSSVSRRRFRGGIVARALDRLITSPTTARRCRDVAARLDGMNGIALACDLIEQAACQND
ncbi:MAG: glycosyltransferase family 1 protein [Planctomycetales bacterium]|nr:glycosyltransferase family 1 protein [Planctomycetales bacterium]